MTILETRMGSVNWKVLIAILAIHAAVVAGFLLVHLSFTLTEARLEPLDVLASPGDEVELACSVVVDPPGPAEKLRGGLTVAFRDGNDLLGTAITDAAGIARLRHIAGAREHLHEQKGLDLSLEFDRQFAYHRRDRRLLVETLAPGAQLYLCDIESTLAQAWDGLDLRHPEKWKAAPGTHEALNALSRGSLARVIYLAPGRQLVTIEVRDYLLHHRFPLAPVLFLESDQQPKALAEALRDIRKKWPRLEYCITRRAQIVTACAASDIATLVVGARPGSIPTVPNLRFAQSWRDVGR